MAFDPSSHARLNRRHLELFPGESLFARVARTVCEAECLPRKELFESWEVARRVRRRFRGGTVHDLAAGHGLLAALLLILDDTSPRAFAVDPRRPPSSEKLWAALVARWPRLAGRLEFSEEPLEDHALDADALVVSAHACGGLTDHVLRLATNARARVAVLPCCHDLGSSAPTTLAGWMDGPLAMDAARAMSLAHAGYEVTTTTIPAGITPKNRLILGAPRP